MFGLYSKLIAAAMVAALLAGIYWRGHTQGYKARDVIAQADIAKRTADALQAEQDARAREAELQTKVGKVDRAYQDQKRATATVASAAAVGMRNLETILARPGEPASSASAASGANDPRDTIIRECAGAVVTLGETVGRLQDKTSALQDYAASVCLTPRVNP